MDDFDAFFSSKTKKLEEILQQMKNYPLSFVI